MPTLTASEVLTFPQGQEETYLEEIAALEEGLGKVLSIQQDPLLKPGKWGIDQAVERVRATIAQRKVALRTLKAGYNRITLTEQEGWIHGFVEDVRPHKNPRKTFLTTLVPPVLLLVSSVPLILVTATGAGLVGGVGLIAFLWAIVTLLGEHNENIDALRAIGIRSEAFFLRHPVPANSWSTYQRAKTSGLFEEIRVYAPITAFNKVLVPEDPIIYGRIGDDTFLITQWGLREDLYLI